jgi:uncharacterized membrane protein
LPDELVTFFTAMIPIGELRASIPLGILTFDLSWPLVLLLSIVGNLIPVPFLIWGLKRTGRWLESFSNPVGNFLLWRSARLEAQLAGRISRYGPMALVLIVAIPLPMTGAWTGSLAVWALKVPLRQGLPAIAAGVVVAGVLVTALTLAGIGLLDFLF